MTEESPQRLRAFIAVALPEGLRQALQDLIAELSAASGSSVRWVRPEGMHVTLQFLGDVEVPRLDGLRRRLEKDLSGQHAFVAHLRGVGAFPNVRAPRVIWVGAESPELGELAARVGEAVSREGLPREDRPFRGHVTLGRLRRPAAPRALAQGIERHRQDDFGPFKIDAIHAYRSWLRPGGAVYTTQWTIPFRPTTVGEHDDEP